jgi:hypothetical protein
MDMASSKMLVANDGYFNFKHEGTYGAFRIYRGKELVLNHYNELTDIKLGSFALRPGLNHRLGQSTCLTQKVNDLK